MFQEVISVSQSSSAPNKLFLPPLEWLYETVLDDNNTYRRKLIFVRRDFVYDWSIDTKGGPNINSSFLCGAQCPLGGEYNTRADEQQKAKTMKWIEFGEPYYHTNRLAKINETIAERKKKLSVKTETSVVLEPFQVIISSLPYFHYQPQVSPAQPAAVSSSGSKPICFGILNSTDEIFGNEMTIVRKQVGTHIFVNSLGMICSIKNFTKRIWEPILNRYKTSPINAIYPIYSYDWEDNNPTRNLCYGLIYKEYTKYDQGSRYYHRFGEQCLQAGGVFELTEQEFEKFRKETNEPFVAIYVCAGAKLQVMDDFHITGKYKDKHNRSLYQQGAIVIAMGKLMMEVSISTGLKSNTKWEMLTWDKFCGRIRRKCFENFPLILSSTENLPPAIYAKYQKQVIFLGATDSSFNSIAWSLFIETKDGKHSFKLTPPELGHIIAIENGKIGLDEIRARINYEVLHDSVLSPVEPKFELPDFKMVEKILDINQMRAYYIPQDFMPSYESETKLPKEFNICYPRKDLKQDFFKKGDQNCQKERLAVPPMYPFICENNQNYTLPSNEFPLEFMKDYYKTQDEREGTQVIKYPRIEWSGKRYKCEEETYQKVYHFTRVRSKEDQVNFDPKFSKTIGNTSTANYRQLGVDGWIWQKTETQIYQQNQMVYKEVPGEGNSKKGKQKKN